MSHIDVVLGDKTITKKIEFSGGSRSRGIMIPGKLKTDDQDIIKYLDDNLSLGKWTCIHDDSKKVAAKKPADPSPAANEKPAPQEQEPANKTPATTVAEGFSSDEVKNMSDAKAFILEKLPELDPTELNGNKQFLQDKIKELGFDFPNFK